MNQKFDKSVEKKRLRNFWTEKWFYNSIEDWMTSMNIHTNWYNSNRTIPLIKDGLKKLTLEKKITEQELFNLLDMLDSSDDENKTIVLLVMQKYKKTKFKK